ncbi:FMN-dependent NADH-azoreductase [Gryllotalpicola ginsengisoli]|uniref:FMN-dependent NADH-azoreductase n=1 Tax=Gryllotalpicola ginsengisoli TaxID=444608 RepID=UPI0003B6D743|nr:NAD(P)H-dependent oxidoreductase [Gryllotalpicola ginsengisoli]
MSTVFRLDSSIRVEGSVTRAVADTLEKAIVAELGDDTAVIRREIGTTPLPSDAWATAAFAGFVAPEQRSEEQNQAVALAEELAAEVAGADALILGVPFYNWGVSQHFKTWADLMLTTADFNAGNVPPKHAGKPAYLIIARGGGYSEGTPKFGWDHATDWIKRVLVDVWGFELEIIETELTLAEVTPAMAGLVEKARENLAASHAAAEAHAKALAGKIAA